MRLFVLCFSVVATMLTACATDTFVEADGSADGGDAGPTVSCGASACAPGETCCIYSGSGGTQYACNAQCGQAEGGAQLSVLACTSGADCAGEACCIRQSNGGNVSICEPQCNTTNGEVQLCDPNAADAGCSASQPCSTDNIGDWGLPNGFATCGGRSVP